MEKTVLTDKEEYPSDKVLQRTLGETKEVWDAFFAFLAEHYPLYTGEWRYYRDGNSWLFKLTKKKKTVCWISVYEGKFKTTFYFADKAEELILNSRLKKALKEAFINGKHYGKIRGLTVDIKETQDLSSTKKLIEIKEALK